MSTNLERFVPINTINIQIRPICQFFLHKGFSCTNGGFLFSALKYTKKSSTATFLIIFENTIPTPVTQQALHLNMKFGYHIKFT